MVEQGGSVGKGVVAHDGAEMVDNGGTWECGRRVVVGGRWWQVEVGGGQVVVGMGGVGRWRWW